MPESSKGAGPSAKPPASAGGEDADKNPNKLDNHKGLPAYHFSPYGRKSKTLAPADAENSQSKKAEKTTARSKVEVSSNTSSLGSTTSQVASAASTAYTRDSTARDKTAEPADKGKQPATSFGGGEAGDNPNGRRSARDRESASPPPNVPKHAAPALPPPIRRSSEAESTRRLLQALAPEVLDPLPTPPTIVGGEEGRVEPTSPPLARIPEASRVSTPPRPPLSPTRGPTPSPLTPHFAPVIDITPAPLPQLALQGSAYPDPTGALARRLDAYKSFSTAGAFVKNNIHLIDDFLIGPQVHDTYVIKTVSTIKCDECQVKLKPGGELFQCKTCSAQICYECVNKRLERENRDAASAASAAQPEPKERAADDEDDGQLGDGSADKIEVAKGDGTHQPYQFEWQGSYKHMPFKLCYLDRQNHSANGRGPWEGVYDVVDQAGNWKRVHVKFVADQGKSSGRPARVGASASVEAGPNSKAQGQIEEGESSGTKKLGKKGRPLGRPRASSEGSHRGDKKRLKISDPVRARALAQASANTTLAAAIARGAADKRKGKSKGKEKEPLGTRDEPIDLDDYEWDGAQQVRNAVLGADTNAKLKQWREAARTGQQSQPRLAQRAVDVAQQFGRNDAAVASQPFGPGTQYASEYQGYPIYGSGFAGYPGYGTAFFASGYGETPMNPSGYGYGNTYRYGYVTGASHAFPNQQQTYPFAQPVINRSPQMVLPHAHPEAQRYYTYQPSPELAEPSTPSPSNTENMYGSASSSDSHVQRGSTSSHMSPGSSPYVPLPAIYNPSLGHPGILLAESRELPFSSSSTFYEQPSTPFNMTVPVSLEATSSRAAAATAGPTSATQPRAYGLRPNIPEPAAPCVGGPVRSREVSEPRDTAMLDADQDEEPEERIPLNVVRRAPARPIAGVRRRRAGARASTSGSTLSRSTEPRARATPTPTNTEAEALAEEIYDVIADVPPSQEFARYVPGGEDLQEQRYLNGSVKEAHNPWNAVGLPVRFSYPMNERSPVVFAPRHPRRPSNNPFSPAPGSVAMQQAQVQAHAAAQTHGASQGTPLGPTLTRPVWYQAHATRVEWAHEGLGHRGLRTRNFDNVVTDGFEDPGFTPSSTAMSAPADVTSFRDTGLRSAGNSAAVAGARPARTQPQAQATPTPAASTSTTTTAPPSAPASRSHVHGQSQPQAQAQGLELRQMQTPANVNAIAHSYQPQSSGISFPPPTTTPAHTHTQQHHPQPQPHPPRQRNEHIDAHKLNILADAAIASGPMPTATATPAAPPEFLRMPDGSFLPARPEHVMPHMPGGLLNGGRLVAFGHVGDEEWARRLEQFEEMKARGFGRAVAVAGPGDEDEGGNRMDVDENGMQGMANDDAAAAAAAAATGDGQDEAAGGEAQAEVGDDTISDDNTESLREADSSQKGEVRHGGVDRFTPTSTADVEEAMAATSGDARNSEDSDNESSSDGDDGEYEELTTSPLARGRAAAGAGGSGNASARAKSSAGSGVSLGLVPGRLRSGKEFQ